MFVLLLVVLMLSSWCGLVIGSFCRKILLMMVNMSVLVLMFKVMEMMVSSVNV